MVRMSDAAIPCGEKTKTSILADEIRVGRDSTVKDFGRNWHEASAKNVENRVRSS